MSSLPELNSAAAYQPLPDDQRIRRSNPERLLKEQEIKKNVRRVAILAIITILTLSFILAPVIAPFIAAGIALVANDLIDCAENYFISRLQEPEFIEFSRPVYRTIEEIANQG